MSDKPDAYLIVKDPMRPGHTVYGPMTVEQALENRKALRKARVFGRNATMTVTQEVTE